MACADCEALNGASIGRMPHMALQYLGTEDGRSAAREFATHRYHCAVCSTRWERDMDYGMPDTAWRAMDQTA